MNDERFLVSGWEDDLNDIDEEENPHETPEKEVLWAAENGELNDLKRLIEANAELINIVDKDGYSPLHRACYGNHIEMVEYLLTKGANIGSKTQMKWEPLHSCCQWSHTQCAIRLLQEGADVNAISDGGQTPLHVAANHGACYDMIQLLLMHPYIKPELVNNSKETAENIAKRSSKYYHIFEMADPAIQGLSDI
ncbi:ankyrin repeat domain-containing protein 49-like [Onthophagus taurus]|uniref:ankyrin repeat domain-containing protein 49-like n=1 Tax=Onthophagus taurus TaxID=166361 RepID=UPI000C20F65C|nr:ankyrin repeat domain-containing protein 49-like [Onthophagus taurus]